MIKLELTQQNLSTLDDSQQYYLIIKENIKLTDEITDIPVGSVLDFRGGTFRSTETSTVKLNLNDSIVRAASYCIFSGDIEVTGFNNDEIKAEWFNNKTNSGSEQVYINRAIVAANGCPVVLEHRNYALSAPIVFPAISRTTNRDKAIRQTLVAPGTLVVTGDDAAIDVKVHNVWLKINRIEGRDYHGTGVRYSENCYHGVADVREMVSLERGFDVSPNPAGIGIAGVQYIKFIFQSIRAKYCFYVFVPKDVWFSESYILGGYFSGENGIYFSSGENEPGQEPDDKCGVNGLVFNNICFDELTGIPMRLYNIQQCNFFNLCISNSLSELGDNKCVCLEKVETLDINFNTLVRPNSFEFTGKCRMIYVNGFILYDKSYNNHFDRLLISKVSYNGSDINKMVATTSRQPFNMCKNLVANEGSDEDPDWRVKEYSLEDILPVLNISENGSQEVKVLPSTLNVEVTDNNRLILDISSITQFAPCALINVFANVTPGGEFVITSTSYPSKILSSPGISVIDNSATLNEVGLYRLTWNSQFELVISKVTD